MADGAAHAAAAVGGGVFDAAGGGIDGTEAVTDAALDPVFVRDTPRGTDLIGMDSTISVHGTTTAETTGSSIKCRSVGIHPLTSHLWGLDWVSTWCFCIGRVTTIMLGTTTMDTSPSTEFRSVAIHPLSSHLWGLDRGSSGCFCIRRGTTIMLGTTTMDTSGSWTDF